MDKTKFYKVAMVPVTVERNFFEDLSLPKQTPKEIKATVASLRLDAVGAAGFGVSRSKWYLLFPEIRYKLIGDR